MLARVHEQRKEQQSRLHERFDQLTQAKNPAAQSHNAVAQPSATASTGRGPALQRTRGVKGGLQFTPAPPTEPEPADQIPGYSSAALFKGKAAQRNEPISYDQLPATNGPDAVDLSIPINYGELV